MGKSRQILPPFPQARSSVQRVHAVNAGLLIKLFKGSPKVKLEPTGQPALRDCLAGATDATAVQTRRATGAKKPKSFLSVCV
jgi:hypothetical protein